MNPRDGLSRRGMVVKLGILLNAAVGAILAVPIVRYLLSPVIRERRAGSESWLTLGPLDRFPAGQTRLATYRNPVANSSDGETANIPCWVRNVDGAEIPGFCHQLRASRVPGPLVPAVRPVHVPVPRRRVLFGRLARLRTSRARLVRVFV